MMSQGRYNFNSFHPFHSTMLLNWLHTTARELGFADLVISKPELSEARKRYLQWISAGFHGEMDYMARHGELRFEPSALVPETVSVITVIMPYLPAPLAEDWQTVSWRRLDTPTQAYISRYAHGRDYHKVVRARLQKLADALAAKIAPQPLIYRAFSDSAPVPEVAIAAQTRLGWRGKHTLLINRQFGSMFFLGELFVNLELPTTPAEQNHCGSCRACIDICPTQAIIAPYQLDARRCISYLTIEYAGSIPHALRRAIGNRIYGCDDCQLVCPWNRFAQGTTLDDFAVRHSVDEVSLLELLAWDEATFNDKTAGSAIRRIGHAQWQRNILLALGNVPNVPHGAASAAIVAALQPFATHDNPILAEQAQWSLSQHQPDIAL